MHFESQTVEHVLLVAKDFNFSRLLSLALTVGVCVLPAWVDAQSPEAPADRTPPSDGADGVVIAATESGSLELQAILPNVIRVHVHPGNIPTSERTLVMDPAFQPVKLGKFSWEAAGFSLQMPEIRVSGQDL